MLPYFNVSCISTITKTLPNFVDEQAATQVLRKSPKILSTSSLGASKAEEQAKSLLTKTHMVSTYLAFYCN